MPHQVSAALTEPRGLWKSVRAVILGFLVILVLSLGTDQILHWLGVYPPWGQPMNEVSDNLLALAYRTVYNVFGCYIAAKLAPHSPMRHALILGMIGLVLSTLGVVAAMMANLGPIWYPIALLISVLPCAWLGGFLYQNQRR
jgi:hypothetical protein